MWFVVQAIAVYSAIGVLAKLWVGAADSSLDGEGEENEHEELHSIEVLYDGVIRRGGQATAKQTNTRTTRKGVSVADMLH